MLSNKSITRKAGSHEFVPTSPRQPSGKSFLAFFYGLLLWLPNEEVPGLGSICVALLRIAILPVIILAIPVIGIVVELSRTHGAPSLFANTRSIDYILIIVFGSFSLIQEIARYSFARRAIRPLKSLLTFAIALAICELLLAGITSRVGIALLGIFLQQLICTVAMLYAVRNRKYTYLIIAALVVLETVVEAKPGGPLFDDHSAASPSKAAVVATGGLAAAQRPATTAISSSPQAPSVGGMAAWAKVYPGATVVSAETKRIMLTTIWRVEYTSKASPAVISAFYKTALQGNGFTDRGILFGSHGFSRGSSTFSFVIVSERAGSHVQIDARASDAPAQK